MSKELQEPLLYAPEIVTDLVKPEVQWTDDERRLVILDSRLKNMIVTTLPTEIMKLIIKYPTSKEVWDRLCSMYEGSADTIKTKKIDLKRAYENFFSLPDESLDSTYTRFKGLLNDMTNVGIVHDNFKLCHKFIDSLPLKWQNLRQILRTTKQIQEYDLEEIFGVLQFEEKALAQNMRAAADAGRHVGPSSSSPSMSAYSVSDPLALVSAKPINLNVGVSNSTTLPLSIKSLVDDLDAEEKQDMFSDFTDFALIAGKRRKAGGVAEKVHYQKECKVSMPTPAAPKSNPSKSANEYRNKYYQLKAKVAETEEAKTPAKGLVAEEHDWANSDESDDEEYVDAMCLMALADGDGLTKDQVSSSQWVNVTIKKFVESLRAKLQSKLNSVSSELSEKSIKLMKLKNVHVELQSHELLTQKVQLENEKLKLEVANLKKIVTSWSKASKFHHKCLSEHVPAQVKEVISGDYNIAASLADSFNDEVKPEISIPPSAVISPEEM
uniref:uncharacterized protein LOC122610241 n=1 Tax=Erigeron canadensis TaxID=72917 RepID=UPI001CB8E4AC|nr:uncharacterized protein LOC122610241 [Erigeron canadensis]